MNEQPDEGSEPIITLIEKMRLTCYVTFGKRKKRWSIIGIRQEGESILLVKVFSLGRDRDEEIDFTTDGTMTFAIDTERSRTRLIGGTLRIKEGKRVTRIHPCTRAQFEEFSMVE